MWFCHQEVRFWKKVVVFLLCLVRLWMINCWFKLVVKTICQAQFRVRACGSSERFLDWSKQQKPNLGRRFMIYIYIHTHIRTYVKVAQSLIEDLTSPFWYVQTLGFFFGFGNGRSCWRGSKWGHQQHCLLNSFGSPYLLKTHEADSWCMPTQHNTKTDIDRPTHRPTDRPTDTDRETEIHRYVGT